MKRETWKQAPGFGGWYEVSDRGRVRSLWCRYRGAERKRPKVLAPMPDTRGYLQVGLYRDARRVMVSVHGLVMRAFVGPSSLTVNHIDHDKTNNRLANLEYLSHRRNKAHGCAKKRKLPTGVGLRPSGRYTASIRDANGKQTHLGMFDTPGEASEAYQAALAEIET